jgi:short subunit dehydrogenase-like uncharacterized protein
LTTRRRSTGRSAISRSFSNCAGPFSRTADAVAEACLRRRAHYLDITGEMAVFEAMAARGASAEGAPA